MPAFLALLAALPAFIQSLPYLFQVALKLMVLVEKFITWAERREFNQWLSDCEKTLDQLSSAKTPEEKQDAAKATIDLIRKLN
jgi:hypothetical protein